MRSRPVPPCPLLPVLLAWLLGPGLLPGCTSDTTPPPVVGLKCQTTSECNRDDAPICDPISHTCRRCQGAQDDAACRGRDAQAPHCGEGGVCRACGQSEDCRDPLKPACVAGVCGLCQRPEHCLSQVCLADGSCARTADVVYVDNMKCDHQKPAPAGTPDDPLCEAQAGADRARADKKPAVHLAGSPMPYAPVTITETTMAGVVLSGSASGVEPASIRGDQAALTVLGSTGAVLVTAQWLDLSSKSAEGVVCDQRTGLVAPRLTLRRSQVHEAIQVGLRAARCNLTVDGVQVYDTLLGGLSLGDTTYKIDNLMVYHTRGTGISISKAGAGSTLRFSTVFYNAAPAPGQPSGIACKDQELIEDSIVAENIGTGSQFGACKLTNVVTGTEMIAGGISKMPEFVMNMPPFDLHLKKSPANMDCCIDKVAGGTDLIDHDIDGTRRPQGSAWDIGAHEVQQ